MLQAIIVDDERRSREVLSYSLNKYCSDVKVVDMADGVSSGIISVRKYRPDLVFLDVEMADSTGFDFLSQLGEPSFEVIFISGHSAHAVHAFKTKAIDYLLKPVDIDELVHSVKKVHDKLAKDSESGFSQSRLDTLCSSMKKINNQSNKIALPTLDGLVFVPVPDVVRCEAAGNYTRFYLVSGEEILVSKTMKEFELLLSDRHFCRVHHSHLINLSNVRRYVKGEGGYIITCDGATVLVSRRKKDELIRKLNYI